MVHSAARTALLLSALAILGSCALAGSRRSELVDLSRGEWNAAAPVGEMRTHVPHRLTIHHTASLQDASRTTAEKLRALQRFSQTESPLGDGRIKPVWPDVPYHFYIAVDGTVAEAREARFVGDSNTPYDPTGHLLIVVEGNFEEEIPSAAQLRSLDELVLGLARRWEIPGDSIASHRDFAATLCPGEALYRELPRLRRLVGDR